jgi:multiple sugar transport system ATP-binding protein
MTAKNTSQGTQVTFDNVTKRFGTVVAVDRLGLTVSEGELLVLLGPSGCGKTTSLRMLAGLESVTSGTIRIGNTVVNDLPPRSRNIAMVFQSYALYPHMRVIDNISYPLKIAGVQKSERYDLAHEVAKLLQIDHLLDRKPRELSGGERQRVALGRAIIRRPNVFLMDEPLSNLDAKLRVQMRGEMKRLHAELGVTTIYVTHDQAEALTLGDKIAIMRQGVLQQVDSPKEIYERPANVFVGSFLGSPSMNFLNGTVREEGGRAEFQGESFRISIPTRWLRALESGDRHADRGLILGIRPENIQLSHRFQDDHIRARIYVVENMGNETVVEVDLDGHIITARVGADFEGEMGDPIGLRFNLEKAYLFHPETEECLV